MSTTNDTNVTNDVTNNGEHDGGNGGGSDGRPHRGRLVHRLVGALLRLYPAAWRKEYGLELSDLLLAGPLGPRVIGDVLRSGMRERLRATDPATLLGCALALVMLTGLALNIAVPSTSSHGWTRVLRPSSMTVPTIYVTLLASDLYHWCLAGYGGWSTVRRGASWHRSGLAAMKVSFIAGIPVMIAGVLMLSGILGLVVLEPADVPTNVQEHGFAYPYASGDHRLLTAVDVLLAPLFRLPESWLWGTIGAMLGRRIASACGSCGAARREA